MGGGYTDMPKVPDYRKYKWEDFPQWRAHQARLHQQGLHDPWARNHVWKYMNPMTKNKTMPGWQALLTLPGMHRGFVLGVAAIGIYIAFDKLLGKKKTEGHGHGHGEHH